MVPISIIDQVGLTTCKDQVLDLVHKMEELRVDDHEYICIRFLILLNPGRLYNNVVVFIDRVEIELR